MDKFSAMQAFVRVAEKGSFSAVARELGIGQPAVSKQLSALEDDLGTELIHRNGRSVTLTEAGRDFYESSLRILEDFENATSRIGRGQTAPRTHPRHRPSHLRPPPHGLQASGLLRRLPRHLR